MRPVLLTPITLPDLESVAKRFSIMGRKVVLVRMNAARGGGLMIDQLMNDDWSEGARALSEHEA